VITKQIPAETQTRKWRWGKGMCRFVFFQI